MTPSLPAENEIHIWRLELNCCFDKAMANRFLTAEELQRGYRLINEQHRRRFLSAHIGLRRILSFYLAISPQEIEIYQDVNGKPFIIHPINLQFNMSHSGDIAIYAITQVQQVGVDIERIKSSIDYPAVAERFFTPAEYQFLLTLPAAEQLSGFYKIWVRKEAYIKASGLGLRQSLSSFNVLNNPFIIDLPTDPGYAAALSLYNVFLADIVCKHKQLTLVKD